MGNKLLLSALLTTLLSLSLQVQARADNLDIGDVVSKIPALKQGIAYSVEDSRFNYLSTIDVFKYGPVALEFGYAGPAEETGNKIVGVVSYDLLNLKKLGVQLPILDLVEFRPGLYAGYGRIQFSGDKSNDNEFDWGISATILSVKF